MSRGYFQKLAAGNIRKNGKIYFPYILTCILTVAMYYIVKSLSLNPGLTRMAGADTLNYIMEMGSNVIALFSTVFLFYTNSFLMKRRKKEFGLFNILGMEKKHISGVLLWEMFYVTLISLGAGLLVGIALDKVMFLLIAKILGVEIPLGFFLSGKAVGVTCELFCVVFLLLYLNMVRQIQWANPIELLKGGQTGEREPRVKWVMALLGILCLGSGYYLALSIKNPMASITVFFPAVFLVIAGTYLLFTAGSITLLKLLRKNKKYYYQTRHFTSVSGMIYRMKQNAVGLANICILSTAVLIMVSSTTSLVIGIDDILATRYPNDFTLYAKAQGQATGSDEWKRQAAEIAQFQKNAGIPVTKEIQYTYLSFGAYQDGENFYTGSDDFTDLTLDSVESIRSLFFVPLADYNRITGENKTLKSGEILLYTDRDTDYKPETLKVFDKEYKIAEKLNSFLGNGMSVADIGLSYYIVVPDMEEIYGLEEREVAVFGDRASRVRIYYGFDTASNEMEQEAFYNELCEMLFEKEFEGTVESKAEARASFFGLYGGLFFLGIFLGSLFLMATVLIIYYKQISEGYEDRERFVIMQKVGMSWGEVRSAIHSQVLTVFFLPLAAAGIHVAVAFPLINKMLMLLNLQNMKLYMECTAGCFLVFALLYVVIYTMTARTYYRIVKQ